MFRSFLFLAVLCLPVFLTAACAGAKAPTRDELLHRRFVLTSVDGVPQAASPITPDIEFNEGFRVSGRMCNRYAGQGKLENGLLTVGQMISTKMLCTDDALNRLDGLLAAMLAAGARADLSGGTLTLRQGGHTLVFTARDWVH